MSHKKQSITLNGIIQSEHIKMHLPYVRSDAGEKIFRPPAYSVESRSSSVTEKQT